jgi:hypothetical protein
LSNTNLSGVLDTIAGLAKRTVPGAAETSVTLVRDRKAHTAAALLSGVCDPLYVVARVNWELESGDKIEEFVAALLLLRHNGPGNRITPSSGDRGVDVRLTDPDGIRFY